MHLNWLAILLATISSMIVGTVYYLPKVFGNRFQALTGADPTKPKSRGLAYGGSFFGSAITAIVIAGLADIVARSFDAPFLGTAVALAAILWLSFTALRMLIHETFESRDLRIWAITIFHELITVVVMAVIIGLLGR
ncbi:hypothetical protein BH11ACT3_BH11ACT3_18270 [soil metagenome]